MVAAGVAGALRLAKLVAGDPPRAPAPHVVRSRSRLPSSPAPRLRRAAGEPSGAGGDPCRPRPPFAGWVGGQVALVVPRAARAAVPGRALAGVGRLTGQLVRSLPFPLT